VDSKYVQVNLSNIGNGVANELFQHELEKVLANIDDVNSSPTDVRKITLEVLIKPSQNREMGEVKVKCFSKLAGIKPAVSSLFFFKNRGKPAAFRQDVRQPDLGFNEKPELKEVNKEKEAANA
jgi:hypothetical protein